MIISASFIIWGLQLVTWLGPQQHDFGLIAQGEEVHHVFYFKNNSPDSIFIDNVRTTCGCTAPEWDQSVIAPSEIDSLVIRFSDNRRGNFKKNITVFFHQQRFPERLRIIGIVD